MTIHHTVSDTTGSDTIVSDTAGSDTAVTDADDAPTDTVDGPDHGFDTAADQGYDESVGGNYARGAQDVADRHALRRVAGLSTELTDITEVEYRKLQLERVVLVGVWAGNNGQAVADADASMAELARLAETAGSVVLDAVVQRRRQPDPATYIGTGKVDAITEIVAATGADTVICDGELSPSQLRNLEERTNVKVIDRTALILDIFAQHARSREGKAQVELAQLNYLVPRLRGWGAALSRQRGGRVAGGAGIGSRGPGETKLEIDRRRIHKRIAQLRRDLVGMQRVRENKRGRRLARAVPAVAIAGYTNAGKSSLLNRLTDADVLVEDALFATLDPTTRQARTGDGRHYTLTDTVGFVRHLPHQLVESFRSTLEEIGEADVLVHVIDGSDGRPLEQISAVREVLTEIDAARVPELLVVNKIDALQGEAGMARLLELRHLLPEAVFVSARTGEGIDRLKELIAGALPEPATEITALVPYDQGALVSRVHSEGTVLSESHEAGGTLLTARVHQDLAGKLLEYRVDRPHGIAPGESQGEQHDN